MRICLKLQMNGTHLPYDYRRGIQAFIYSAMDPETGRLLHDSGQGVIKLFTFSRILGPCTSDASGITFSKDASLWIASPSVSLLKQIYAMIEMTHHIELFGNFIPVTEMHAEENREYRGTVRYQTLSPVTMYTTGENGYHTYYSPDDADYRERLRMNIARKYEQLTGAPMEEYFNFYRPEQIRKRVCTFKGFRYTAYDFTCSIDTVPLVHSIILDCGLGARNPAGFGMVRKLGSGKQ